MDAMDLDTLLSRLQFMRQAYNWDGVPQHHMKEALEGDAKKLAEAHLLVERRLKAAAVQQNKRRSNYAMNKQRLDDALAVSAKAEECGVQVLPNKKKRPTGQANTSTEGDAKRSRREQTRKPEPAAQPSKPKPKSKQELAAQPTERAARQQTRSKAPHKRNGRK